MARQRIPPGAQSDIILTLLPDGRWEARGFARGADGRLRESRIKRSGKAEARREVQRRLEVKRRAVAPTIYLGSSMTVEELADYWLRVRARGHGEQLQTRGRGVRSKNGCRRGPSALTSPRSTT